jgi:hypothetical protein
MRIRHAWLVGAIVVLGGTVAQGAEPAPHIVDPRGDANALTFPYAPGGVVGNVQRTLFPDDPLGPGTATEPASLAPADLLSVRFETTFVAIPIGEDGIDYRGTGIRVDLRTTEAPRSLGLTTLYEIATHLPSGSVGCRHNFSAVFPGQDGGNAQPYARAGVGGSADGCWAGEGGSVTLPAATLTVVAQPPGLVIQIAADTVPEDIRPMFEEGGVIQSPVAWTALASIAPRIDGTLRGPDFIIGSDMPADVPCTKGCS